MSSFDVHIRSNLASKYSLIILIWKEVSNERKFALNLDLILGKWKDIVDFYVHANFQFADSTNFFVIALNWNIFGWCILIKLKYFHFS